MLDSFDKTRDYRGCIDVYMLRENLELNGVEFFVTGGGIAKTCIKFIDDERVCSIYDKLVCQLANHSQAKIYGTHLFSYAQPKGRLAESFGESVNTGITHVEIRLGPAYAAWAPTELSALIDDVVLKCGQSFMYTPHKDVFATLWHNNMHHLLLEKNRCIFWPNILIASQAALQVVV